MLITTADVRAAAAAADALIAEKPNAIAAAIELSTSADKKVAAADIDELVACGYHHHHPDAMKAWLPKITRERQQEPDEFCRKIPREVGRNARQFSERH